MQEQRSEREGKEQEKFKLQSFKFTVRRRTAPADRVMGTPDKPHNTPVVR